MTRRTDKVSSVLQHEIGDYITQLELPALTTISKVEVTPDLKWSTVWITVMGTEKQQAETVRILEQNISDLQRTVNRKLTMKFVPRIRFQLDHAQEYAAKINELLRKTHEQ